MSVQPGIALWPMVTIDKDLLARSLESDVSRSGGQPSRFDIAPEFFAKTPVMLRHEDLRAMEEIIAAVESVVGSHSYLNTISQRTPAIATLDHGPVGVFFGYDFHTTPDGPRLIEINTNAGGA
ncbi:MAG: hypothetical protein GY906_28910, partial [bacterium]|nr:hypothetical protein [bacterium]